MVRGKAPCTVLVSTDRGTTWQDGGEFADGLDLSDLVKGRRQYWLRFKATAKELESSGLTIITTCQLNAALVPRLVDWDTNVTFQISGKTVTSAGPNLAEAKPHLVVGKFGTPRVTLELQPPRREPVLTVYAAAHVQSSSPPRPDIKYQIDVSVNGGEWKPMVKDWTISRRGEEPKDFWSQSLCWGSLDLAPSTPAPVRVRFSNSGGKNYLRCEAHLVHRTERIDSTKVTFAWTDDKGSSQSSATVGANETWKLKTGRNVQTRWVEFAPVVLK